jgi:hypothetical protein
VAIAGTRSSAARLELDLGGQRRPWTFKTAREKGKEREKEMVGPTLWRGIWRPSRNGGWEGGFGGVLKMQVHIETLLELFFFIKPPNFGVEAHIEAIVGVALNQVVKKVEPAIGKNGGRKSGTSWRLGAIRDLDVREQSCNNPRPPMSHNRDVSTGQGVVAEQTSERLNRITPPRGSLEERG